LANSVAGDLVHQKLLHCKAGVTSQKVMVQNPNVLFIWPFPPNGTIKC